MRQFKPSERRVWTHKDWQEVLSQSKDVAKRHHEKEAELERLVKEGKLRKVITREGNITRIHYEKVN